MNALIRLIEPQVWRVVRANSDVEEGSGPTPTLYDGDRVWVEAKIEI